MTIYAAGIGALADRAPGRLGGARAGQGGLGFVVTPGQIEAKVRELSAIVEALDTAIAAYVPEPQFAEPWAIWAAAWRGWRDTWRAFAASPPSLWWGGTADLVTHYEQRLAAWQDEFQRRWKGASPGPSLPLAPKREGWIDKVTLGVSIAVGTGVVLWLLQQVFALKREVTG